MMEQKEHKIQIVVLSLLDIAGITKGSIIVGFNGITIDSMESLQEQLQYYKKGEKVTLTLQVPGDGGEYQEQTVDVTLGSKAQ